MGLFYKHQITHLDIMRKTTIRAGCSEDKLTHPGLNSKFLFNRVVQCWCMRNRSSHGMRRVSPGWWSVGLPVSVMDEAMAYPSPVVIA